MFFSLDKTRLKKREARRRYDTEGSRTRQNDTYISDGETISELMGRVSGSGSGSGLPLLVSVATVINGCLANLYLFF